MAGKKAKEEVKKSASRSKTPVKEPLSKRSSTNSQSASKTRGSPKKEPEQVKMEKRSSGRSQSSKIVAKSPSPPAKQQQELKKVNSNDSTGKKSKSKSQTKKEEIKEQPSKQSVNVKKVVQKSLERIQAKEVEQVSPQTFMEFNQMVSNKLKPSGALAQHAAALLDETKFTPDLSKAQIGTHLDKDKVIAQDTIMMPPPAEIKRKPSTEAAAKQEPVNLLAQAKLTGPQKHINRLDAVARATGGPNASANAAEKAQQEKKQMLQMAALGGIVGKSSTQQKTKDEMVRDKQTKDKIALQENSLVSFAMAEQPDLYAPNNLPFFNREQQYEAKSLDKQPAAALLKKAESSASAQLQREQQSSLKLLRLESDIAEQNNEVKNLFLGNSDTAQGPVQPRISENEPFILQLPSTLPIQSLRQQGSNTLNQLMEQLSVSESLKQQPSQPKSIGKVLVMKSGKVIMRMPSEDGTSHVDFELIKGIETNFYQELISAHPSKKDVHFLGQVNHKVIAVPDLDQIFQ